MYYFAEFDASDRVTRAVEGGRPQSDAHHVGNNHQQTATDAGFGWKTHLINDKHYRNI